MITPIIQHLPPQQGDYPIYLPLIFPIQRTHTQISKTHTHTHICKTDTRTNTHKTRTHPTHPGEVLIAACNQFIRVIFSCFCKIRCILYSLHSVFSTFRILYIPYSLHSVFSTFCFLRQHFLCQTQVPQGLSV